MLAGGTHRTNVRESRAAPREAARTMLSLASDKCPRKQCGSKGGRKDYAFGQMPQEAVRLQGSSQVQRFRAARPTGKVPDKGH